MGINKEFGALAQLEGMFTLKESVKLYIPTETKDGKVIDNSEILKKCAVEMDESFGGATVINGVGYWSDKNNNNKLYTEDVNIIQSFTGSMDDKKAYKLIQLAQYVKKELKQEAVTIEVNNQMKFI